MKLRCQFNGRPWPVYPCTFSSSLLCVQASIYIYCTSVCAHISRIFFFIITNPPIAFTCELYVKEKKERDKKKIVTRQLLIPRKSKNNFLLKLTIARRNKRMNITSFIAPGWYRFLFNAIHF